MPTTLAPGTHDDSNTNARNGRRCLGIGDVAAEKLRKLATLCLGKSWYVIVVHRRREETPNDPKLSDRGGLARPLPDATDEEKGTK